MLVEKIGTHLQCRPPTLSHHLSSLVHTGLVVQPEKMAREVANRAFDFDIMNRTVSFPDG